MVGSTPTVHVLTVSAWVLASPGAPASSRKERRLYTRSPDLQISIACRCDCELGQTGYSSRLFPRRHPKTAGALDSRRSSDGVDQLITSAAAAPRLDSFDKRC